MRKYENYNSQKIFHDPLQGPCFTEQINRDKTEFNLGAIPFHCGSILLGYQLAGFPGRAQSLKDINPQHRPSYGVESKSYERE